MLPNDLEVNRPWLRVKNICENLGPLGQLLSDIDSYENLYIPLFYLIDEGHSNILYQRTNNYWQLLLSSITLHTTLRSSESLYSQDRRNDGESQIFVA